MITVELTDGRHSIAQFQMPALPGVGDVLTIVKGESEAVCYTVISRGFAIHSDPGGDQASVAYVSLKVRESNNVEASSFQR